MALHLNFYHEIRREADARARDPFKLAGLAGLVVALLFLGYYFYRNSAVKAVERRLATARAEWKRLEPAEKEAKAREAALLIERKNNDLIVEQLQNRFYWAPFFAKVAAATPPTVQITSMQGTFLPDSSSRPTVSVSLSGIAAGAQPRSAAEQFRLALEKEVSALHADATVNFEGANSLAETGETVSWEDGTLPTAQYRIRVTFHPFPEKQKEKPAEDSATKRKATK